MQVSLQTQRYCLDICQVQVYKGNFIYVNRSKRGVRKSDGRFARSPFNSAKYTYLLFPVKFGQYGQVRRLTYRGLAPFHNEKFILFPSFSFFHLRWPNDQLGWVPGLRRRPLNRCKDHDMRSFFSGPKWTVCSNYRGFHNGENFYCTLKSPPWRGFQGYNVDAGPKKCSSLVSKIHKAKPFQTKTAQKAYPLGLQYIYRHKERPKSKQQNANLP